MARSVCGALNWAGKEGRPDASAAASMYSSKLKTMVVSDLLEINKVAKRLQENAGLTLQVQKLDRMKWGVVTDASWANTLGNKSQGGHVIITLHEELMQGKQAKTNVLIWKSGKLPRVVGSTLAETQSLARGVGEMIWAQVVYLEITEPGFNLHDWQHQVRERGYLALASEGSQETLQQALAVVDAKSLYDIVSKDTHGGQDRRNAIDLQLLKSYSSTWYFFVWCLTGVPLYMCRLHNTCGCLPKAAKSCLMLPKEGIQKKEFRSLHCPTLSPNEA